MNSSAKQTKLRSPGIFISYRRSDSPDATGRIYDRLVSEFGKASVFKDVDSIPLGQDFRGHLNQVVGGCAAVLAIIGPRWADARDAAGQRRLEDADDLVRVELEAALSRDIPVVPVLVAHAPMPGAAELPAALAPMAFRQSIELRPDPDFHNDATRLVSALRAILDPDAKPPSAISLPLSKPRASRWLVWALAVLTVVLAVPALKYLLEPPLAETRVDITVPTPTTRDRTMALSPDGRQIVFVSATAGVSRLWLRALDSTTAHPLPGTEQAALPFWSPDSRSIGFFTISALKRIEVGGGVPVTLAPVINGLGGSWSADGVILFAMGPNQGLARLAATGGPVTQVTHLEQDAVAHEFPVFMPDGHRFLYLTYGGKAPGTYLSSLEGTPPVKLTPSVGYMAFLPRGWLLRWDESQRALLAQRLDASNRSLMGVPMTLAEGGAGSISTSAGGLIAYWSSAIVKGKRELHWRNRSGGDLGSIGEPDETYAWPRVSPDAQRVAVVRGDTAKGDIWLLEGARASRLTFDASGSLCPVFSPDGTQIVFSSLLGGDFGLYQKPADGTGEKQLLMGSTTLEMPSSWSQDGRYLMYVHLGPKTSFDLGVLPMTADRKPWMFLDSSFVEGAGEFSPDGKWVAYSSNETGRYEVYIRPFLKDGATTTGRSGKWQISIAGGTFPKWSPNGREVFFLNRLGDMMAAPISVAASSLTPGLPVKLFQTRVVGSGQEDTAGPQYDLARDGRFLINEAAETYEAESSPIVLIQNWNPAANTR